MSKAPIPIAKNTYEIELPTGDKAEIGDILSADFKPNLKLKRWGEECSLILSLPTTEKIKPVLKDDKILWPGKNYGAEFFRTTDGFKFNIIISEKPKTNIFLLDFASENLNFYYQPPLTEEYKDGFSKEFQCDITVTETDVTRDNDGKILVHRPENVVGSYAVYYPAQEKMLKTVAEGEKYKTGKAFHWYRPLIYDSAGHQTWGVLNVDPQAGIRTVTIPQNFLDTAVYPVTIDDTFGYESEGASDTSCENIINGSLVTCTLGGMGVSITAWMECTSVAKNTKCALYDAADPNSNIITDGGTEQIQLAAGFDNKQDYNFLSPPTLVASTQYTIVVWSQSTTGQAYLNYDSDTGTWRWKSSQTYNGWPANIDWSSGTGNKLSIYCTYTPAGGAVTVTPTTLALTLTTYAPTVSTPRLVTPSTLSLALTAYAPTVLTPRLVTPTTLALILATYAPSVTVSGNRVVTPSTLALILALYAPTVTVTSAGVVISRYRQPEHIYLFPHTRDIDFINADDIITFGG